MKLDIVLLPGDGIGPEIIAQAERVLASVACRFLHRIEMTRAPVGGEAIDLTGDPLPEDTLALCRSKGAVLLGAMGGPRWDDLPADQRPEKGLLRLREGMGVYANLRPVKLFPQLASVTPLKEGIIKGDLDLLIVRELTGGIYFGRRGRNQDSAFDTEEYSRHEIMRVAHKAFEAAKNRRGKLTLVDKANVLESSRFWREIVKEMAKDYPEVEMDYLYVDNAAMQLIINPGQFDVILTSNMFGDILSDEASVLSGSIGMLPSASLGEGQSGLYEPAHGSAPDIAGKNQANPLAAILSAALLLRHSYELEREADLIERAVAFALDEGLRTGDIWEEDWHLVGTREMGEAVVEAIGDLPI